MSLLHRVFIIFAIAFFVIGSAGCQKEGPAEKAGEKVDQALEKVGKKVEKAEEYMGDSAITAKIKADILGDPLLKVSQIEVTTTNGVVNLTGAVDSQQGIDRAMEIARSVKDVKSVESSLVAKGE